MSTNHTFLDDLTVTIGHATKKSDFDKAVENTLELDERLEGLAFLGGFLPLAGAAAIAYETAPDGSRRITTATYTGNPAGVVTFTYDDGNGGRVDYVELAMTDPVEETYRVTFTYDGNNEITNMIRTLP